MPKPSKRLTGQYRNRPFRASQFPAVGGPSRPEITAIDEVHLEVGDPFRRSLWWLTIPMACIMLCFPVATITDLVSGYYETRRSTLELQRDLISMFGESYLQNVINAGEGALFVYTYPDAALSFSDYLRDRWIDTSGGWRRALFFFGFTLCFTALSLFLFYLGLLYRRAVPLIFDRKRRAAYTWRKGMALAAPWESITFIEQPTGIVWQLQDSKGKARPLLIPLGGNLLTAAQSAAKQEHVERIAAFMLDGASAIEGSPFRRNEPFSLRVERTPVDLDLRIDNLLARIRGAHSDCPDNTSRTPSA